LDDLVGLRDLRRLRLVGVLAPVVFLATFEAFRIGVIDAALDAPASNLAAGALGVAAALGFGLVIFLHIDRAQREVVRRNRDLAIVNEVAAATQGELDADSILDSSLHRLAELTGSVEAAVVLHPVDPEAGPDREVVVTLPDRAGDALAAPEASVELPLIANGRNIARLRLTLPAARLDDLPSKAALRTIADQLGTTLHIAQLVGDLHSRRLDGHTFYRALMLTSNQAPLPESLTTIVEGARDRLGADEARVCLTPAVLSSLELDPASEAAITDGIVCEAPGGAGAAPHGAGHPGPTEHAAAAEAGDRRHDCRIGLAGADAATLRAPLWAPGELLGDLWVARLGNQPFTERDRRYLFTLAGIAAIAIVSARLRQQERHGAILAERDRIARELHDSLAQVLGSTHLRLRHLLAGADLAERPRAAAELTELADIAEEAYRDVREAILGLREAGRPRGFLEALQAYVEKYAVQSGIEVALETSTGAHAALAVGSEIQVLRVIQEALTNVRKHARASTARVRVADAQPDGLMVVIEDDGRGFDPTEARVQRDGGFGLQTMRERIELVGGSLRVESSPNEGTRIIAIVPASSNGHHAAAVADHR
jgi:two-component system nitrate/nitrite sensor histidine kinase NarX